MSSPSTDVGDATTSTRRRTVRGGAIRPSPRWLTLLGQWAPLIAVAVFFVFAVRADLAWHGAVRALLVVAVTQILPGALLWRAVRPRSGWLMEDLVAGLAVGAAIAVVSQVLAGSFQVPALAWIPGVAVAVMLLAVPGLRGRVLHADTSLLPWWWGPATAATTLPLLVEVQRFYRMVPIVWESGFRAMPTDVYFHLALTGQLAHRGPGDIPFVAGEPLSYHWFSHAWVAQIATAGSVPLDQVLFRVGPPLLAVALAFAVAVVAVRITGRAWSGPVAALIAVSSGDVNLFGGLSPFTRGTLQTPGALSLGFASLLLVVLVALLTVRWRGDARTGSWFVVLVLATGVAGGKGSALPLVLAGTGLAFVVVAFATRSSSIRRRIGADLCLLSAAFVGTFLTIFGGSARTVIDPQLALSEAGISAFLLQPVDEPSVLLVVSGAVLVLASVLARAGGLLAIGAVRGLWRDPVVQLLLGVSVAGALAVILLSVGGKSQYYFLRNAIPLMAIASALGFASLRENIRTRPWRGPLVGAVAGGLVVWLLDHAFPRIAEASTGLVTTTLIRAGVAVSVFLVAMAVAARLQPRGERWPGAVSAAAVILVVIAVIPTLHAQLTSPLPAGPSPQPATERFGFSADQIEAARWLRDHSDVDEVVMTNRHCASPVWVNCDSRRFAVTAFTERPVLLEGWAYTRSWSKTPGGVYKPFWNPDLQALNDEFLADPTAARAERLYEEGVRWIYIDKSEEWSGAVMGFATPVYETKWALIFELEAPAS